MLVETVKIDYQFYYLLFRFLDVAGNSGLVYSEMHQDNWLVAPIPAYDKLITNVPREATITCFDINGVPTTLGKVQQGSLFINTLKPGSYILVIEHKGHKKALRFIKI